MAIRRPAPAGGGANPFQTPRMNVTVVGVEAESSRVMVRDTFGNEFVIDAGLRPKGTGMPVSGEQWMLAKIGGHWTLEMQIGALPAPIITGDRAGLHPVAQQMLDAMAALGLVVDLTEREAEVPPDDDTTDPSTPDPSDVDWVDDGEDDLGVPADAPPTEEVIPAGKVVNDDKVPGSKVSSDLFTATSYNLLYKVGPKRAAADLRRIYSFSDVAGLQECARPDRGAVLAARPDHWGMYRPPTGADAPILWNKDVFSLVHSDTKVLSTGDGPGTFRPHRPVNWVRLAHRATGVEFWFVNMHWENAAAFSGFFDPHRKPASPRHIERYKEQMGQVVPLLRDLGKSGPVILVGDFNVHAPADLRLRNPGLPTAEFGRIGMRSNWDLLSPPEVGTFGVHGTVFDWKMLSNKIPGQMKFVSSKVLRGYSSDHRPVVTKIRIKNFA